MHYATIFLWVCGNVTWALGEFFFTEYDEPIRIWHGYVDKACLLDFGDCFKLVTNRIVLLFY